ncbi:MAG: twin-arginine translocation signal domain-containing protein, partial [Puniceicoccales bacterium]|nr:twin-arginine translocation signal domain-containing protein [Puniceicoccales bacterium]
MTSRRLFLKTAAAAAALFGFDGAASLAAANVRAAGTGANASRKSARNIIFMVADGMCAASLALT